MYLYASSFPSTLSSSCIPTTCNLLVIPPYRNCPYWPAITTPPLTIITTIMATTLLLTITNNITTSPPPPPTTTPLVLPDLTLPSLMAAAELVVGAAVEVEAPELGEGTVGPLLTPSWRCLKGPHRELLRPGVVLAMRREGLPHGWLAVL